MEQKPSNQRLHPVPGLPSRDTEAVTVRVTGKVERMQAPQPAPDSVSSAEEEMSLSRAATAADVQFAVVSLRHPL